MRNNLIIAGGTAFALGLGFASFVIFTTFSQTCRCSHTPDDQAPQSITEADADKALENNLTRFNYSNDGTMVQSKANLRAHISAEQVRILCWVMTTPENHETKAIHVKNTWGKRCNKLIFMSSQSDEQLGAVGLPNVKSGREWLWAKATGAFKYIWEHHRDEADWFMKADDDTYVILENLRYMLSDFESKHPIYFGCRVKLLSHSNVTYMSGGAGYVLSKEALRRLVEQALPDKTKCKQRRKEGEDVEIGMCLEAVGVKAEDGRDAFGRYRFLPFTPRAHVFPGGVADRTDWYRKWIYYPQSNGMECCSERAISFHYMEPSDMYAMEYLIYNLRLDATPPKHSPVLPTIFNAPFQKNQLIMPQLND